MDIRSCVFTIKHHDILLILVKTILLSTLLLIVVVKANMLLIKLISFVIGDQLEAVPFVSFHYDIVCRTKVDHLVLIVAILGLNVIAADPKHRIPNQLNDQLKDIL